MSATKSWFFENHNIKLWPVCSVVGVPGHTPEGLQVPSPIKGTYLVAGYCRRPHLKLPWYVMLLISHPNKSNKNGKDRKGTDTDKVHYKF